MYGKPGNAVKCSNRQCQKSIAWSVWGLTKETIMPDATKHTTAASCTPVSDALHSEADSSEVFSHDNSFNNSFQNGRPFQKKSSEQFGLSIVKSKPMTEVSQVPAKSLMKVAPKKKRCEISC